MTSFSASQIAIHLLRGPPLSAAPLRRLRLDFIEDAAVNADAVKSVLGHHGGSLEELALGRVFRDEEPTEYRIVSWLNAASAGMPNLRALTLNVDVDEEAAAAVARLCPALTELNVSSKVYPTACAPLRLPALPALSNLCWSAMDIIPQAVGLVWRLWWAGGRLPRCGCPAWTLQSCCPQSRRPRRWHQSLTSTSLARWATPTCCNFWTGPPRDWMQCTG